MAYATFLASVDREQIRDFRDGVTAEVFPNLVVRTSHLLPGLMYAHKEIAAALRRAIDGGELLHPSLWHPLRPPLWIEPQLVADFDPQLRTTWQELLRKYGEVGEGDWYVTQILSIHRVFNDAATHGYGVASFLEAPTDLECARKVVIPMTVPRSVVAL